MLDRSTRYELGGVRIVRLEPAPVSGWWLAFRSADKATFARIHAAVRALPGLERRWIAGAKVWWISEEALATLGKRIPTIRRALGDAKTGNRR